MQESCLAIIIVLKLFVMVIRLCDYCELSNRFLCSKDYFRDFALIIFFFI
jgi:hypothetical protein